MLGNSCIQCSDNGLIDRLICPVSLQLFLVFAGQFLGVFQFIHLGLVIQRGQRTLGEHGFNSLRRNGIAALKRLHHRVLAINELLVPIDFAIFVFCEVRIQLGNGTAIFGGNLVFLIAQGFTQLFEESRSMSGATPSGR